MTDVKNKHDGRNVTLDEFMDIIKEALRRSLERKDEYYGMYTAHVRPHYFCISRIMDRTILRMDVDYFRFHEEALEPFNRELVHDPLQVVMPIDIKKGIIKPPSRLEEFLATMHHLMAQPGSVMGDDQFTLEIQAALQKADPDYYKNMEEKR